MPLPVICGIGRSKISMKRGACSGATLAAEAVLNACSDGGIAPRSIDGFVSYGGEQQELVGALASRLGVERVRLGRMRWGGGGGGLGDAVGIAASAVEEGEARAVAIVRVVGTGDRDEARIAANDWRYRYLEPAGARDLAHIYALQYNRWVHNHGGGLEAQLAVVLASYFHASRNPLAQRRYQRLDRRRYLRAPWVVEPWRLYDCCLRGTGAGAVIVTAQGWNGAERGAVTVRAVAGVFETNRDPLEVGRGDGGGAGCQATAAALWERAGIDPGDVDVVQCYDNFSGGVVAALCDYGLFDADRVDETMTVDALTAPAGTRPLNTDGGQLADAYLQGLGQVQEAVRQLRGTSVNQVPGARMALVAGGPFVGATSGVVLERRESVRARVFDGAAAAYRLTELDEQYWEALARGELRIQRCANCASWRWPPGEVCRECGSLRLAWETTEPEGVVWSLSKVWHVAGSGAQPGEVPYLLVVVELSGAPEVRLVGRSAGGCIDDIAIGTRVRAEVRDLEGVAALEWHAVPDRTDLPTEDHCGPSQLPADD